MSKGEIAIGIDLGMTHISVSVILDGKVTPVPDASGDFRIPCVIGFTDSRFCVGLEAVKQQAGNLRNTVFAVKRLLERDIIPLLDTSCARLPFRVVSECQLAKVEVRYLHHIRHFFLEEFVSILIAEVKKKAEAFLGATVDNAVVGVPAHFNSDQRMAIIKAGSYIGLKVVSLSTETSLVAVGALPSIEGVMNFLVFDFGGNSSSASVIQVSGRKFKVISTAGTDKAGGKDIDDVLVEHCLKSLDIVQREQIQGNHRALYQLGKACEAAKRTLSTSHECTIKVPSLFEEFDFTLDISRDAFEDLCQGIFNTAIGSIKEALAFSTKADEDIDTVLLAGGSNQIPKMKSLIENLITNQTWIWFADPDAVSRGAALIAQAAYCPSQDSPFLKEIASFDILSGASSQSVMVKKHSNGRPKTKWRRDYSLDPPATEKLVIIPRASPLPASKWLHYPFHSDDNEFSLSVYESQNGQPDDNVYRYTFKASDIPPSSERYLDIEYQVDLDGVLVLHIPPREGYHLKFSCEERPPDRCYEFWELDAQTAIFLGDDFEAREQLEARLHYGDFLSTVYDVMESEASDEYAMALEDIYVGERAWLDRNKHAAKELYSLREEWIKKYTQRARKSTSKG